MSGDQQASSSFGDPNAQPPTPKQTPTSAGFPSPVFETPRHRQGQFTDPSHWTPRFAEEYSVFNTTPGNLRGTEGLFDDFASLTQFPSSSAHKRHLSAEGIAAEIASHATHFSPNPNLPPVDPSRKLQSSPRVPNTLEVFSEDENERTINPPLTPKIRSTKKAKKGKAVERAPQDQIVTPPPSSHKGGRKLAPRLPTDTMQNDQGYGHPDFTSGTPQQPGMASFSATDMFGYPMSAPAGAGANFWDPNADLGMDIDFAAFGHNVFQTPTQTTAHTHRSMHSFDATQMFQEPSMSVQTQPQMQSQPMEQTQPPPAKTHRPLAPKTSRPQQIDTTTVATTSMSSISFSAPSDDPFGIVSPGGVDPGLLFSRPPSSGLDVGFSSSQPDPMTQISMASVAQALSKPPVGGNIRRSNSSRELAPARGPDRALASSPIKSNGRPGLQRSFSENRGRRNAPRNPLPTLAPALRPSTTLPSNASSGPSRPPSTRSTGRTSPLKSHTRLSSLTSIPEATPQRTRTSVKFTIDSKGRARAETTVVVEDPSLVPVAQGRPPLGIPPRREQSFETEDDEESSSDDEPIIIPSRNTSFALPDPKKPSGSMFHNPQRSISERSNSSFATGFSGDTGHDGESDAETVMNESRVSRGGGGDAASELRKVVESRHKRMPQMPGSANRFVASGFAGYSGHPQSPTMSSLLTPSTHGGGRAIRCVCHRNENEPEVDMFMVQCESCELWLHGQCINIPSKRVMPSVYICAFCANTPNMRGGRLRDRGPSGPVGASPLAHKSFKSFR